MQLLLLDKIKLCKNLALGFSGGADSLALATLLHEQNIPFTAVHFHHHLREISADKDAQFCQNFCQERNIPFLKVDLWVKNSQQNGESIETTARRLRQEYWQKNFSQADAAVLLAHHKDDLLENFFIRSLRGSSSSGLSGLKAAKSLSGVTYLRPLVNNTKAEIIAFLKARELSWCEDETNNENIYTRNIIRNKIIPELQNIAPIEGLYRTIHNVATDADFIEQFALQWLAKNSLTKENFSQLHPALKPRILRQYIYQASGYDFIPSHETLARIELELQRTHEENCTITLGHNLNLILSKNGDIFLQPQPYELEWHWQTQNEIILPGNMRLFISENATTCSEAFAVNSLSPILKIRTRKDGDAMIPFSHKSPTKVKDLFADKKIKTELREKLPLIFSAEALIWIPSVRRAEFGLVEKNTNFVNISYEQL